MEQYKVVPDVVDEVPPLVAEVTWPSGVKAELGNILTPTQVKDLPKVTFKAEEGALYCIVMTDIDCGPMTECLHWILTDVKNGDSSTGKDHTVFIGSGPPENTGLHRYVFLVFKQPNNFKVKEPERGRNFDSRIKWSARKFALDNNLGKAEAGNFYRAEFDSYVPILHKEVGIKV